MIKRYHVYVAGPYTPVNCSLHDAAQVAQQNVLKVIEIANAIFDKGHYAFIPHLSHYTHIFNKSAITHPKEFWYEYDLTFLRRWADSLLYTGSSFGADRELKEAKRLYYRIFYKLEDIPCLI